MQANERFKQWHTQMNVKLSDSWLELDQAIVIFCKKLQASSTPVN